MYIYKFKKTLQDQSLAVVIIAKDLLDASRFMNLLIQLEPEKYQQIDLDSVRVLEEEPVEFREAQAVIYDFPYPKFVKIK